jgi:hypothetical protein
MYNTSRWMIKQKVPVYFPARDRILGRLTRYYKEIKHLQQSKIFEATARQFHASR